MTGKGGLTREIAIDRALAEQLDTLRLAEPRTVTDRKIYYEQFYGIGGGKQWVIHSARRRTANWDGQAAPMGWAYLCSSPHAHTANAGAEL